MFTQPCVKPIPNGRMLVNSGFGNRCVVCGQYFDECGICNYGHRQGQTYYYPPEEKPEAKKTAATETSEFAEVVCQVFSGCRCNICGGFFADGNEIVCSSGHQIGQKYPKKVR